MRFIRHPAWGRIIGILAGAAIGFVFTYYLAVTISSESGAEVLQSKATSGTYRADGAKRLSSTELDTVTTDYTTHYYSGYNHEMAWSWGVAGIVLGGLGGLIVSGKLPAALRHS